MCDPLTMGLAMGGSQLVQGLGARSLARDQNKIAKTIAERETENAIAAAARDAEVIAKRERQEDFSAHQASRQSTIESALARGTHLAGAASGSVEGTSIDTIEQDFAIQEALAQAAIEKQREFNQEAIDADKAQLQARTQNRINAAQPNLQPVPSLLGTFLQVGTSAAQGYMSATAFGPGGERLNAFTGEPLK